MKYSLAKELKDAGWPQEFKPFLPVSNEPPKEEDYITRPTLEELIEACGGTFRTVGRDRMEDGNAWDDDNKVTDWEAVGWKEDPPMFSKEFGEYTGEGSTPTEAVARLWLALNKR